MGQERSNKQDRKQLRKALGPGLSELVAEHNSSLIAISRLLNRGFFGRLKWIFFGR